ncbi:response regulator [Clostridium omnivorum]|uniref:Stage 0 sporulation protein A homolog n=1 Tax=Clostridium omnivorum TaxID=1604902 RepID=A0ABQ5N791_9CLOT|nr:response regulator [Clostridium sp. E14]GLC31108.1 hypothetical protein bsdE14_25180 [Clostridium sp. E14]
MYKLILVDDEQEVREGILKKVEWEKYGFDIVGQAENGREALEIAERTDPDVVITDIKMPFMDGIRLSEELSRRFPTTKVIILTGFDEFEYAQKAVKLNVVEYVLKPVSANELVEILSRVKLLIDEEKARKEDINTLKEYYVKSLPILREKFMTTLITNKLHRSEIMEKAQSYNLDLNGNGFMVSVVSLDYNLSAEDGEHKGLNEGSGVPNEMELIKVSALNLCSEIAAKNELGIVFLQDDKIVIIAVSKQDSAEQFAVNTVNTLEEIRTSAEKYLKSTVTIGIGTFCTEVNELSSSYKAALSALDYRIVLGNNRTIWIADIEPQAVEKITFDELKERALMSSIKVGTEAEIGETIDNLFKEVIEIKASIKDYQIYLLEILTTITKIAKNSNVDMDDIFGNNYNFFVELYKFNDINEVKSWVKDIALKLSNYITKDRQDTVKLIVRQAKDYAKENYNDSEITINKICEHLHISPTYFSLIFKRETKTTFINYLTKIRMEAAKELLRTTDKKTFEIAEKVGYSEPNYFSYSFKKNFGISPSEYRNSHKV